MNGRDSFDICIIGAGVIGLAIAYELGQKFRKQSVSVVILEKEAREKLNNNFIGLKVEYTLFVTSLWFFLIGGR